MHWNPANKRTEVVKVRVTEDFREELRHEATSRGLQEATLAYHLVLWAVEHGGLEELDRPKCNRRYHAA